MAVPIQSEIHQALLRGVVIPACPLALNAQRRLDERRQRGLVRYYLAAGARGVAVGVHTTQFAIRDPKVGLFRPVLELAANELRSKLRIADCGLRISAPSSAASDAVAIGIGGICGPTRQALAEATLIGELGFHAG